MESTPERVTVSYPSELSMLDRCADLQGGHWTILGTESKFIGPASHFEVVDNLIPEMDEDFDSERKENEQGQGPSEAQFCQHQVLCQHPKEVRSGKAEVPTVGWCQILPPRFR